MREIDQGDLDTSVLEIYVKVQSSLRTPMLKKCEKGLTSTRNDDNHLTKRLYKNYDAPESVAHFSGLKLEEHVLAKIFLA